jgi:D-arabinan exo alpha-(1,3)/(1,5)-arabinofuranosidase (non-reducing end)
MGGGSYSYFPIPYSKELKIQVTPDKPLGKHFDPFTVGVYYQVTYQTFPKGAVVRSLELPLCPVDAAAWATASEIWQHPGQDPKPSNPQEIELTRHLEIQPGESAEMMHLDGEGVIDRIFLKFTPDAPGLLRSTLIQMRWSHDAKEDVDCPVGDFFGNGFSQVAYRSLAMGLAEQGYYSYFAMPYSQGASIRLVNESTRQPINATLTLAYHKVPSLPKDIGYFHAGWRRQQVVGVDLNHENNDTRFNYGILDAHGQGRFIGFNLNIFNRHVVWWGEGDPMIVVDDEKWPPAIHGTGTEEYFNDAWGFHQDTVFKASGHSRKRRSVIPVSGVLVNGVDTPLECFGGNAVFSFNVADSVPFQKHILVTIEHGTETDDLSNDYSSTAYWYAQPGEQDFFLMSPPSERKEIPMGEWLALRVQAVNQHLVHLRMRLAGVTREIAFHPTDNRLSWSRAVLLADLPDHGTQLGLTAAEQDKLKQEWKHPGKMGITQKPVIDVIYRQLAALLNVNGPRWNVYPPKRSH